MISFEESGLKSWMGRIMYDYDNKYMFSLAMRSDGSSRLSPGYKWHTYPAVSAGWNLHKEAFMEDVDWVNNLKSPLRLGTDIKSVCRPLCYFGTIISSSI